MYNNIESGSLLDKVHFPSDLRALEERNLVSFCQELRDYIIEHCSIYGGHFAASLGVVELTTALHYVYNTPEDLLVWDVGHQAYGHKIITGRRARFATNRTYKGISGFPKREESPYDTFGVGHSSTSISAALGMAVASKYLKNNKKHIAVIGDGSMTAGLAFEGMNHAGSEDADVLVILNDNCMSIDPNVGALKEYLTDITTSKTYNKIREELWNWLGKFKTPKARNWAAKFEQYFTASLTKPGVLFESLGFRYFGPVDGHDVNHLVRMLKDLKEIKGPKLLHVVTVKGKGFEPAEKDQTLWHAPGFTFDKITGASTAKKTSILSPKPPKFQDVFGKTLLELAQKNSKIMGVTPAMPSGCSMNIMMEKMPERTFDVGIAEQHAVTFSAGLATQGLIPFCNIYSSFMQRAYDQVIHDVALQNLKVVFCLDRGGFVGADGATHHGVYDLAYMRCIPNLVVAAPMNEQDLRNMMYSAQSEQNTSPYVIRYPRGEGSMLEWQTPLEYLETGKGHLVSEGEEIALVTIGTAGILAQKAIEQLIKQGITPAHYDMRFVKPLDTNLLHHICQNFKQIITIEDGCIHGGFGSAIAEFVVDQNYFIQMKRLGIPDRVVEQGTQMELYQESGFDPESIATEVIKMLENQKIRI